MVLAVDTEGGYHAFPHAHSPLDALYDEARRLRRAIIQAATPTEADRHRHALDDVETRIDDLEANCGCEGFPAGK